ncbi:MAG TPA: TetR/AcrR family transcriptional regulator [Acidisoma sp.]|uniref:TetR/AcrR family transcriptional regulator n=1 Tax=Acidisoma sp. TaxID=1872115 RepID=UPI002BC1C78E|nr:TetR/AcrR family transcriptional regulator [Acidisoma sp.]HTH99520.1 TetR/AcrR family transcriptional regulator [Acidisoma sp.]
MTGHETKEKIMEAGRLTVQAHGYMGLSFRELAKDVGIKTASIHYYFPTKGALGGALAERYTRDFSDYLEGLLESGLDPTTCIAKYTDVFRNTLLNENRMCLGGIMAAEHEELPVEVQVEVVKFSEMNARWLAKALSRLDSDGPTSEDITNRALAIFAAIQGAQLVARGRDDVSAYDRIVSAYRTTGLLP